MYKYQGNFQVFPGDRIVASSGSEYIVCVGYNPTGPTAAEREFWLAFGVTSGRARLATPSLHARATESVNLEAIFDFPNVAKVVRKGQVVKPESPLLDLKLADLKTITLQGHFGGWYYTYEVRVTNDLARRVVMIQQENRDVVVLSPEVTTVRDFMKTRSMDLVSVTELVD